MKSIPLIEDMEIKKIKNFFQLQNIPEVITTHGTNLSSNIHFIHTAFKYLLDNKHISLKDNFLDAGSGNGSIVALASHMEFNNSLGVEGDSDIFQESKKAIQDFRQSFHKHCNVIEGNFGCTSTYKNNNFNFQDFNFIFNFMNNHELMAHRINQFSKPGTKFIFYSDYSENNYSLDTFPILKKIDDFQIKSKKNPMFEILGMNVFRVYEKQN